MIPLGRTPAAHRSCNSAEYCRYPGLWRGLALALNFAGGPMRMGYGSRSRSSFGQIMTSTNPTLTQWGCFAQSMVTANGWLRGQSDFAGKGGTVTTITGPFSIMAMFDLSGLSQVFPFGLYHYTSGSTKNWAGVCTNSGCTYLFGINARDNAGTNRAAWNVLPSVLAPNIPYSAVGVEGKTFRTSCVSGHDITSPTAGVSSNSGTSVDFLSDRHCFGRRDLGSSQYNMQGKAYACAVWSRALTLAESAIVAADPMVLFRRNPAREFAFRPNIPGMASYLTRRRSENA